MGKAMLVTGGAGFIGSHVCEALLARGDRVVILDNFDTFYDPAVKRRNLADVLCHSSASLVEGDIRNDADLDRVFGLQHFDAVIHLAARAGVRPSIVDPVLYDDVNINGTTRLLRHSVRHRVGHFVFGSSSSVYGATSQVPFAEDEPADRPSSPYAATKRAGELAGYAIHHLYGLPVTCLRFFTVYGPRQRPEMAIHKFTRMITDGEAIPVFGSGLSRRDYTFCADITDGVLRAADRPNGYRIYNLGTTATTSLNELVAQIADKMGVAPLISPEPDQPGDVPITFADISRAQRELGYEPKTPLGLGLSAFVAWYRETSAYSDKAVA